MSKALEKQDIDNQMTYELVEVGYKPEYTKNLDREVLDFLEEEIDYLRSRGEGGLEMIEETHSYLRELEDSENGYDSNQFNSIMKHYEEFQEVIRLTLTPWNRRIASNKFEVSHTTYGAVMNFLEDIDLAENSRTSNTTRRMTGKEEDYNMIARLVDSVFKDN